MKRYRIRVAEETFDVEVLDDPRQRQVRVQVNGELLTVEMEEAVEGSAPVKEIAVPAAAPARATPAATDRVVVAPLPGTVKRIAVRPGVQVSPGDELLVIEAMKMDNIIRAARGGRIGAVHAVEGQQVAHGEALLEYEHSLPFQRLDAIM